MNPEEYFLTPEELRKLDGQYRHFPSFSQWASGLTEVTDLWNSWVALLAEWRTKVSVQRAGDAIQGAMRAASVNTGAIEGLHGADRGLTFSVVEEAAHWEQAVVLAEGPDALELVKAALDGYEMAVDTATKAVEIHESWIRQLHATVCRTQKTYRVMTPQGWQYHELSLGSYKTAPNHVIQPDGSVHPYAPVGETAHEMRRLVEELRSEGFQSAHPAFQAAYVHHCFTWIHPFADGNGRVARVLASVYTIRDTSIPFVVLDDQKAIYFAALALADSGRSQTFVNFVVDRVVDTLEYIVDTLRASSEDTESQLSALRRVLTGQAGLPHREIDLIARRLGQKLGERMQEAWGQFELPDGVSQAKVNYGYPINPVPEGVRPVRAQSQELTCAMRFVCSPPAAAAAMVAVQVLVSRDLKDRYPFVIAAYRAIQMGNAVGPFSLMEQVGIRLDEVHPDETLAYQMRMHAWVTRLAKDALGWLVQAAEESLRASGL